MVYLFTTILIMAIIGFITVDYLFKLIKKNYPAKYKELGEPSLFYNNSIKNNLLFFKFIFFGDYKNLDNRRINSISNFLRIFFVIYSLLFIFAFILITTRSI